MNCLRTLSTFKKDSSPQRPILRTREEIEDSFRIVAAYYGDAGMPYMGPIPPTGALFKAEFWQVFLDYHTRMAAEEEVNIL